MGSATGFLETGRRENPLRGEAERLKDFEDLHLSQPPEAGRAQASRPGTLCPREADREGPLPASV